MTASDKPHVTVLISTFNRPQYLGEAIESVINQEYENWELIVLNDGGVDVREVVEKFADQRIIYVPDSVNKGAAARFNQGLNMARGEYVTYLGDDDIFYPNHVRLLANALDENPQVAVAYSDLYAASSIADRKTGKRYILDKRVSVSRDFNREFMFHHNHVLQVSLMHRLDAAKSVGGFDENVKVLIEWSLNRRMAFKYDFLHVEEVTGEYHMPVTKSDRISVRERRDNESYKHNLRKIRSLLPPEPWGKIEKVDLLYLVDQWGEKLNEHIREIIDNFDHPMRICLVNNGTGLSMGQIRKSLGNLLELKNISIFNLVEKALLPILGFRQAAKKSSAKYLFLVTPELAAAKAPKRIFASLQFLYDHPEYSAVRWDVEEEMECQFNCLITREYFLKNSRPNKVHTVNVPRITLKMPKGFKFDSMFARYNSLYDEGKFSEAQDLLNEILLEKKGFPHIQYLIDSLYKVALETREYEKLEDELRALIERGYKPDNLVKLGHVLILQGRNVEAIELLKQSLAAHGLEEKDFDASCFPLLNNYPMGVFNCLMFLGDAYLEINDFEMSPYYYHLGAKMASENYRPFLGFAKVFFQAGEIDKAEIAMEKVAERDGKKDPETYRLLGKICQKKKNMALAFDCYKQAFIISPNDEKNVDPFYFAGAANGSWPEMYEPLATFCHNNSSHAMGLARLAAVCFHINSDAMAKDVASSCLKLDPKNPIAKSIYERIAEKEKKMKADGVDLGTVVDINGLKLDLTSSPIDFFQ